jgi:hypothetical protein
MKFFLVITIFSIFMLAYLEVHPKKIVNYKPTLPALIQDLRPSFDRSFNEGKHARLLWSLLTGDKRIVYPAFSNYMNKLQISYLLSFSSIQLSILMWCIWKIIKNFKNKKIKTILQTSLIALTFTLPFLSLKRLALMRSLKLLNRKFKLTLNNEVIFLLTFIAAFVMGQFTIAPLSYIFSFLFIGGFNACQTHTKKELTLCLLSSQIIMAMFFHKKFYLLSIYTSLFLLPITIVLIILGYFYLLSFQWITTNWIENLVHGYMLLIKIFSKLIAISEITPSFAWLFFVWMILFKIRVRYFFPLSILSIAASVCW